MKVIIQPSAKKDLKKLPSPDVAVVIKKLASIGGDPLHYIERLKGHTHLWKLRVGDYRCILFVNTGLGEVHAMKVGHRKNIYDQIG